MKLFIMMEMSWLFLMLSAFANLDVISTRTLNGTGEGDHGQAFCDPQKNSCMNGGKCIQQGDSYYCSCLEGTSGDFCELVEECEDPKFCGDRLLAKCYFNVTKKSADCVCYDERKTFDPANKVCKRICGENNHECENGGTCVKNGHSSYCKCLNGTRGDLCEIVNECEKYPCGYSFNVKCYFDVLKGKAACKCLEEDSVFYEDKKACRKVCSAKNPCKNGGSCVNIGKYSFCSCLDGTSGDLCGSVDGCYRLICGNDRRSSCYFDVEKRKVTCRCNSKEYIYDNETRVCKNVCTPNPCKNRGTCSILNGIANCNCTKRYAGKTCETDECDCRNGYCERNEKGELVCKCPPEWGLNPKSRGGGGCKKCDCGEGANCTYDAGFWSNTKNCICKEGYRDVKGFCKDVCTPNPCRNGGTCSILNGMANCTCPKGYAGKICETDPCYHHNCTNGGLCREVNSRPRCYCLSPFTGEFCEKDGNKWDKLSSSVLFTTPRYLSSASDYNTSTVEKLFTTISKRIITPTARSTTEKNISFTNWGNDTTTGNYTVTPDPCFHHNCMNGGYCREVNNRPRCYCLSPFAGEFCEKDSCTPSPCVNGGTCRIQNTTSRCDCNEPFTGDFCEKDPCTENPCQHGGTCFLSGDTFKCICKEAFIGKKCESSFSDIRYVLTVVALSLLIIIFSVHVTCLAFRRCMSKD